MRLDELEGIERDAAEHYASRFSEIERLLNLQRDCQQHGHYEWADAISERLDEMPLEVSCIAIYPQQETMEHSILLGTGGPADRVLVTTDLQGEVESATYQHQDWFTPWTDAYGQNSDIVADFARHFFFWTVREIAEQWS